MGSSDSGWWSDHGRPTRRLLVDETAWMMEVSEFRDRFKSSGITEPVVYELSWDKQLPVIRRVDKKPSWLLPRPPKNWIWRIELEPVPWRIYGIRWFFRCAKCVKRREHLYAARIGDPLLCRVCHDLTYRSAQEWVSPRLRKDPEAWFLRFSTEDSNEQMG